MAFWTEGMPSGIDKMTALIILVINIIMPGVGTILSSALADEFLTVTVLVGVAQLVTSFIVVGFIWAIAWSIVLIKQASREAAYQPLLPETTQQTTQQTETAPPPPQESES